MRKAVTFIGGGLITLIFALGAMATIAPKLFTTNVEWATVTTWLAHPALPWLLGCAFAAWALFAYWDLSSRIGRFADEAKRRDNDFQTWTRNKSKEVDQNLLTRVSGLEAGITNRLVTATDVIERFYATYTGRLADLERAVEEGATWVHISGNVKVTGEAATFLDRLDEVRRTRVRRAMGASGKTIFFKSEIEEIARQDAAAHG